MIKNVKVIGNWTEIKKHVQTVWAADQYSDSTQSVGYLSGHLWAHVQGRVLIALLSERVTLTRDADMICES